MNRVVLAMATVVLLLTTVSSVGDEKSASVAAESRTVETGLNAETVVLVNTSTASTWRCVQQPGEAPRNCEKAPELSNAASATDTTSGMETRQSDATAAHKRVGSRSTCASPGSAECSGDSESTALAPAEGQKAGPIVAPVRRADHSCTP